MLIPRRIPELLLRLVALSLFLLGAANAHAQQQSLPAPGAPAVPASNNTGTYTVTFSPGQGAMATLLEERLGTSGAWVQISSSQYVYSGGSYVVGFSNKPDGTYYYRAVSLIPTYYGGPPYYVYGGSSSIVVNAGPPPPQDLMSNQLGYTYEARVGDINADGRQDVFVRRTAGGAAGNGALGEVILRRLADGSFSAGALNSAQLAAAASWPVLNTRIELRDFNIDGYVDVLLPNLSSAVSGALGQVIVSSGQSRALGPQRVIPMDAKFNRFMGEVGSWIQNPRYFDDNAPLVAVDTYVLEYRCYFDVVYGEYVSCEYYEVWVGTQIVRYYGGFDQDALSFSRLFNQVVAGILQPAVIPGSSDARAIDNLLRSVFGVPVMRGIFGNPCYDYPYDPIFHLPCSDYNALGVALLATLLEGKTDFSSFRYLTPGEKAEALSLGLAIDKIDEVRVYNVAVPILNYPVNNPVREDDPWFSPTGHVYVASDWRDDYSFLPALAPTNRRESVLLALLMHELMHVYQVRNGHCGTVCMTLLHKDAMQGAGADYAPLDVSVPFFQRNIEQQAEIMCDLYLLKHNLVQRLGGNMQDTPLTLLQAYVPFYPR